MSIWDKLGFNSGSTQSQPTTVVVQQTPAEPTEPPKEDPAPLSTQADWFKPAETDVKPIEFDPTKLFDTDPVKLQEAIGNLNFMQGVVTPEVMAKIEAGGPEATQVMLQVMNRGNQQTMAAAMQAASKMVEQAVSKVQPVIDQKVSHHHKSQQVESAIRDSNPVFQTESGKFMVDALKTAFLAKFPNATSQEIQDNAKSFIEDMIKVGSPQQQATTAAAKGSTDWDKFFSQMQ